MRELSTEIIEIGGKEYTLFLNRKGLVAWESSAKVSKSLMELKGKYNANDDEEIEFDGNANPFELYASKEQEIAKDEQNIRESFIKFYWIALYEKHALNYDKVTELFEKAEKEYGIEQLMQLAQQMIRDVNTNNFEPKKLKALRQDETN